MNEPINHGVPTAVQLQWRRRPRNGAGEVYYTRITAETAWRSRCLGLTGCGSGTSVDNLLRRLPKSASCIAYDRYEADILRVYLDSTQRFAKCSFPFCGLWVWLMNLAAKRSTSGAGSSTIQPSKVLHVAQEAH